jgi:restriction system protein
VADVAGARTGLLEHGLIGGGWEKLPSLEGITSKDELANLCWEMTPEANPPTVANYVGQLWSLIYRMRVGELVVLPLKTTALSPSAG